MNLDSYTLRKMFAIERMTEIIQSKIKSNREMEEFINTNWEKFNKEEKRVILNIKHQLRACCSLEEVFCSKFFCINYIYFLKVGEETSGGMGVYLYFDNEYNFIKSVDIYGRQKRYLI